MPENKNIKFYSKRQLEGALYAALSSINTTDNTKAYVSNVLSDFSIKNNHNFIGKSIVLAYSDIKNKRIFELYQNLADWVLLSSIMMPAHHKDNMQIVIDIGRFSYYDCWRMLNRQWHVYEELSDNLDVIRRSAQSIIKDNISKFL